MQVMSIADGVAIVQRRGVRERLNALLVGDVPAGTWVLAFQGSAVRTLSEEEAQQTEGALQALEAVLAGETQVGSFFGDLVDREPELPAHLKPQVP